MGLLAATLWDWDFRVSKGRKNGEGELQLGDRGRNGRSTKKRKAAD